MEQLLSPDCKVLLSWKELHCQVPTLSYRVPQWFIEIESILHMSLPGNCSWSTSLLLSISPAIPNLFETSQLHFLSIVAGVGTFVIVFPGAFPETGAHFLAQIMGWERGGDGVL